MMVLCLAKDDAINAWRNILGPKEKSKLKEANGTCVKCFFVCLSYEQDFYLIFFLFCSMINRLRKEFDVDSSPVNPLHGATTPEQVNKEMELFFPMEETIALIKPTLNKDKRG